MKRSEAQRSADACEELHYNLLNRLTSDEVVSLAGALREMGLEGWKAWIGENTEYIEACLAATDSGRDALRTDDPQTHAMLICATAIHANHAGVVIRFAERAMLQAPHGDARGLAARYPRLLKELYLDLDHSYWPFHVPDPGEESDRPPHPFLPLPGAA